LEDAQYVQAVIEAVRTSSREKQWTKVIEKEKMIEEENKEQKNKTISK
jgi:hypothetical protein